MPAKKGVKAKGKAKKGTKSAFPMGAARRKKTRKQTWVMYIYKCLKHVHQDVGISSKAMRILNGFVDDLFERIQTEAVELTKLRKGKTLSAREIQTAIRVVLPGELSRNAVLEGQRAASQFGGQQV
jgi:histone H2B